MRLLPLVLSAHAPAWVCVEPVDDPREAGGKHKRFCRFCGLEAASWQKRFYLMGDRSNGPSGTVIWSCVLCHLTRHLERPEIDKEAALIWLPELTQGALNAWMWGVHMVLARHGEPPHMERRPRPAHVGARAAISTYAALRAREEAARERLGTSLPGELGRALLSLPPGIYARRALYLAGLRLLPLGRFFEDGGDIYSGFFAGPKEKNDKKSRQRAGKDNLQLAVKLTSQGWEVAGGN